jgi:hypothetical protein
MSVQKSVIRIVADPVATEVVQRLINKIDIGKVVETFGLINGIVVL